MLHVLIATSTVEKVAWVAAVLLLVVVGGAAFSRTSGGRHSQNFDDYGRHNAEQGFRRPPDEGGLL
jgi:hypothetical protein